MAYESLNKSRKTWELRWAEAGSFNKEGRQSGNWMMVNRVDNTIGFSPFENGEREWLRFLSQAKKPETLVGALEYLDDWSGGRANARLPFLVTAAKAYFEDRANFYSGDFAKGTSANNARPATANNPTINPADDPEVFGRSVRGG